MTKLTSAQKRVLLGVGGPITVRCLTNYFHTGRQRQTEDALIDKGLIWQPGWVLTEEGERVLAKLQKKED